MKWVIEFNLPNDKYDLEVHQDAHLYRKALEELQNDLRAKLKYDSYGDDPEKPSWEDVRKWFWRHVDGIRL